MESLVTWRDFDLLGLPTVQKIKRIVFKCQIGQHKHDKVGDILLK